MKVYFGENAYYFVYVAVCVCWCVAKGYITITDWVGVKLLIIQMNVRGLIYNI